VSLADCLRKALRALRANRLRSGLTILGMVIGIAAVIATVGIGAGARLQVEDELRGLGANLLMVVPGTVVRDGARLAAGSRPSRSADDAAAVALGRAATARSQPDGMGGSRRGIARRA
jgi:putative ABC transport system permease protein